MAEPFNRRDLLKTVSFSIIAAGFSRAGTRPQRSLADELAAKSGGGEWARMWRTAVSAGVENLCCASAGRTRTGDVLVLFTQPDPASGKQRLMLSRSVDEGSNWSKAETIYQAEESGLCALDTLTRLRSGVLLAALSAGGQAGGVSKISVLRSENDGKGWEVSGADISSPLLGATPCGRIVELGDELVMPVFGRWDAGKRQLRCSGLVRSQTGGKAWSNFTLIACDRENATAFGGTAIYAAEDDLLAVISANGELLYRSVSKDGGETWSVPEQCLIATNPALVPVGSTLACVDRTAGKIEGVVRVQFSENLFDSWECDRMLDYDIKGDHSSGVALDSDRLLIFHDRGQFKPEGRGTRVTGGIDVTLMQRNPAVARRHRLPLIPRERRDRWSLADAGDISAIPTGYGETTVSPKGDLLSWSGGRIYRSTDAGRHFAEIAKAPRDKGEFSAGVFGVLRSGRWLLAYPDWTGVSDRDWEGKTEYAGRPDGFDYFRLTGVKGRCTVHLYWSDDEGRNWVGGVPDFSRDALAWTNPYGRFIEQDDGTIVMTAYGCLTDADTSGRVDACGIYRSHDGGKSWGDFSLVAYDAKRKELGYTEMDIQPLPGGKWVAVIRTEWRNHHGGEPSSSSICFSSDHGRTWTQPQFSFVGAVPDMALLPDGGIACATSFNKVRFSYDGGCTWSREVPAHSDTSKPGASYPGLELVNRNELFVYSRWRGTTGCIYRRNTNA